MPPEQDIDLAPHAGRVRVARKAAGLIAGLALILATGCAGDQEPTQLRPDDEDTSTTEPAPPDDDESEDGGDEDEPKDPEEPVLAADIPEEQLQADIDALLRAYFDALNEAYDTGETDPVRAMVGEDCQVCHEELDQIDEVYAEGHRHVGGVYGEFTYSALPLEGRGISVPTTVDFDDGEIVDADGNAVRSFEAGQISYNFRVLFDNGEYTIVEGNRR